MRKFLLALFVLVTMTAASHAQYYYMRPQRTGPYSGYFYGASGTRYYYDHGWVSPNRYYQGMAFGGVRLQPYNPYGSMQFNSMMLGLAAQQQRAFYRQRLLLYGY